MARTAILIGQPALCALLERQLDLLDEPPHCVGWIVTTARDADIIAEIASPASPVLGTLEDLEAVISRARPDLALLALPGVMGDLIAAVRTRLRKLGVTDRYMPPLEDQLDGTGPRTHIDIDLADLVGRAPRDIDEAAVRRVIHNETVLITGAGGSIGGELARICARFGPARLLLMDRSENALFEIDRQIARHHPHLPRKALLHDVVDAAGTARLLCDLRPAAIFHAAAHKHVPMMEDHPGAAVDNNLFGTKSVADAADAAGAERFVMVSTDKAVNPSSIMGATKRLAELYVQAINHRSGTAFSIVRFGNVLGSSGSVLEIWARQIADGGPVTVTDPRMTRYFMTISEAASLVIQSAALVDPASPCGEVYLLDMGAPVNILRLARRFVRQHGLEARLIEENEYEASAGEIPIVMTGARPGEKLHESLAFDAESMRPTMHHDINIWELAPPDDRYVEEALARLAPENRPTDPGRLSLLIRNLVPEMVSSVASARIAGED